MTDSEGSSEVDWPGPRHMRIFGWVMAALIVAVCVYIALSEPSARVWRRVVDGSARMTG